MSSNFLNVFGPIISKFNPTDAFSSITAFLGSGYIGIVIALLIIYGLFKKLINLLLLAVVCLGIWFLCSSGLADQIIATIASVLPF